MHAFIHPSIDPSFLASLLPSIRPSDDDDNNNNHVDDEVKQPPTGGTRGPKIGISALLEEWRKKADPREAERPMTAKLYAPQ